MPPCVLIARELRKTYRGHGGAVTALSGIDLETREGEFVAISGPSGCGKSTLLMAVSGMLRPDGGTVQLAGQDVYALSPERRARFRARTIGFVFQQFHLIPYLSVCENILAARLAIDDQLDGPAVSQRANELMERFGLSERSRHRPGELSTGERQRTALARALLNEPKILLADEPTGNLDEANARRVLDAFVQFAASGGSVLLVTHDSAAAACAPRRFAMQRGCLSEVA